MSSPPAVTSTLAQELKAGFMAAGMAVVLLLIPVVHFVGGPLGPLLGALVMSVRTPLGGRGMLVVGLTLGLTEALVVTLVLRLMMALSSEATPEWVQTLLDPTTVVMVVGGVWAYATALGVMGAALGATLRPTEG